MLLKNLTTVLFVMAMFLGLALAKDKNKDPKHDPNCGAPFCARGALSKIEKAKREQAHLARRVLDKVPEEPGHGAAGTGTHGY